MACERNVQKRPLADFLETPEKRAKTEEGVMKRSLASPSSAAMEQQMEQDAVARPPHFLFAFVGSYCHTSGDRDW